jgi:predicted PolB exonuclease-like 3'-5' exonuclease
LDSNDYKIQKIINSSGIKLVKSYYKFSENSFLNEDKKAILAFKNSQEKANELVKILNYEILEIVSIDDDTSDANDVFELLGINNLDDEKKEMMYSLFEKLNDLELNSNSTKNGAYNLWVTYKIKPL